MKTLFCCQNCGHQSPKWLGRCPECEAWGTFAEEAATGMPSGKRRISAVVPDPVSLNTVSLDEEKRLQTGMQEFDRVLGGGIVPGSLVLVGGDPGIGKSTLVLQAAQQLSSAGHKTLYVSGEESLKQLKMRSERLCKTLPDGMLVAAETNMEAIIAITESVSPKVLIVDSIQTMASSEFTSAPGSVGQVREATMRDRKSVV